MPNFYAHNSRIIYLIPIYRKLLSISCCGDNVKYALLAYVDFYTCLERVLVIFACPLLLPAQPLLHSSCPRKLTSIESITQATMSTDCHWTQPTGSTTRRMGIGLEERTVGVFLPCSLQLCVVALPGAACLQDHSFSSAGHHGTSTLWTSPCQSLGTSPLLIEFLNLAYICVNSSFIKCTSVVSSQWNSIFCWDSDPE